MLDIMPYEHKYLHFPLGSLGNVETAHFKFHSGRLFWREPRSAKQTISCRYYRVLTMVYNTQRYWVFGLCPLSGFFLNNNEKHNVSETGSVDQ
jgi:hypothetical protein